jgi:hypothetical protein
MKQLFVLITLTLALAGVSWGRKCGRAPAFGGRERASEVAAREDGPAVKGISNYPLRIVTMKGPIPLDSAPNPLAMFW